MDQRSFLFFLAEIEEVGFSLDSIPGLGSLLCHFAVTPCRSPPRPCRIARARRGDSICAVGPPIDARLETLILA